MGCVCVYDVIVYIKQCEIKVVGFNGDALASNLKNVTIRAHLKIQRKSDVPRNLSTAVLYETANFFS